MRKLVVVAVLVLAGCGGDDSGGVKGQPPGDASIEINGEEVDLNEMAEEWEEWEDSIPVCEDLVGEPVEEEVWRSGCFRGEKGGPLVISASSDCEDGRVLRWNDGIIGFDGEPVQTYTQDLLSELTAECRGSAAL